MFTIILTNYLTLRRMGTRVRWVKNYLIPNNMLTIILTNYLTLRRIGTRARWVNKYLIPNNTLTIILTNCMTLRRMRTKTRWVNKYLIPYTMLSIILTICMTLRRMRTSTDQLWPDLYINLSFLSVTTGRKRTRKKEKKWTNGKEQLDIYAFHLTTPDWPMDIKIMFLKLSRVLCTCTWSNVKHLFPAFCNDYMYIMSKSFV